MLQQCGNTLYPPPHPHPTPPPQPLLLKGLLPSIFCPFKNWQLDFIELLQSGFRVPGKYRAVVKESL